MLDAKEVLRTTLAVEDDVLSAAKKMAAIENKSVGEILSSLARRPLFPQQSKARIRKRFARCSRRAVGLLAGIARS